MRREIVREGRGGGESQGRTDVGEGRKDRGRRGEGNQGRTKRGREGERGKEVGKGRGRENTITQSHSSKKYFF